MNPALANSRPAAMYSGRDVEKASSTPVIIGAVMPARRDSAEAIPVALPRKETGKRRGV